MDMIVAKSRSELEALKASYPNCVYGRVCGGWLVSNLV